MPIPLPNLDTRSWTDLVDEGRALIPRHAPAWTDHNTHDPGVALIELLAALIEQDIYRTNQIPDRHRRKFLALAGFAPYPPQPAQTVLALSLAGSASSQDIPAGVTFVHTTLAGQSLPFRTLTPVSVAAAGLAALQTFVDHAFSDQTRLWQDGLPAALLGPNPAAQAVDPDQQPAFYLGFDQPLPQNQPVSLWFSFAGPNTDLAERDRIRQEHDQAAANCLPRPPAWPCPAETGDAAAGLAAEPAPAPGSLPPHHAVRLVWDYYDGAVWRMLDPEAGQVNDDTRGLTLDGAVRLTLPTPPAPLAVGAIPEPRFYLRCRLIAGRPDAVPILDAVAVNAVLAEQVRPAFSTFPIEPGVSPPAGQEPAVGDRGRLSFNLDPAGVITDFAFGSETPAPEALIIEAPPDTPEQLTTTLILAGWGTGAPGQSLTLPDAPIASGQVEIWLNYEGRLERWRQRPDLDASHRIDAHFMLDPTTGLIQFGDGEQGRVAPSGAAILAGYETTQGAAGNVAAGAAWQLATDDLLNEALLPHAPEDVAATLSAITNPVPAAGGAAEEDLNRTAGRLAEAFWAHERLVEYCPAPACSSLDQRDRAGVLALAAPARAATLLDFERLALDTPGARVARARAWADLDPAFPCLKAPGTVAVVIMPELPLGRPQPTPGLLQTVRRYLRRRRVIGTRLLVVGPQYITVAVQARLRAKPGTQPARIRDEVLAALNSFFDPLVGGPAGRGWPFGRDVYRSEVMQIIDQTPGVDHVLTLELSADGGEAQCDNLCVGPTMLVTPGRHDIELD